MNPRAKSVHPLDEYQLEVAFENGEATGAYFGHVLKGKLAS